MRARADDVMLDTYQDRRRSEVRTRMQLGALSGARSVSAWVFLTEHWPAGKMEQSFLDWTN
jgi:hypothetical protein